MAAKALTSRERVLAALNHQEPDRIPIDLSGHRSSGIAAMAYARLRDYVGLPKRPIRVYDPVQQLAIVDEDVLQQFHVDTIELGRAFALEDKYWTEWILPDGTPCLMPTWAKPDRDHADWVLRSKPNRRIIARMPAGVWYFEQVNFPFLEREDLSRVEAELSECMWSAVASPPGPITAGPDGERILTEGARQLRRQTDRAIIGLFGGNLLELGQWFYRNDNFLMLLAGEPERAHKFLDKLMEIHLRNLERFLRTVSEHIDIILFGDDLGMQSGPQVSPAMYREYFKPRERTMWQMVKQRAPHLKIQLHCCGGVRELLPDLIDAGLDAINPVQITCRGMEPAGLKRDFGSRLTFWGGACDTREVLINGTPALVRDHVRRQIEIWRPGGGFVFQQVHNILADVPPANVVAMYDAATSM
ncbi:MAG TPA: uroporphyrinogen decarboxylase family protein [Candidatus Limnocylindrales bacterium]|nr:uroporphyrinogen decarboxylase family protein [Candidatus Limnocylindrales bacterium]